MIYIYPYYTFYNLKFKGVGSLAQNQRLILKLAAVGAGHCACPNEDNHRGIAPTKNGLKKNQALKLDDQVFVNLPNFGVGKNF